MKIFLTLLVATFFFAFPAKFSLASGIALSVSSINFSTGTYTPGQVVSVIANVFVDTTQAQGCPTQFLMTGSISPVFNGANAYIFSPYPGAYQDSSQPFTFTFNVTLPTSLGQKTFSVGSYTVGGGLSTPCSLWVYQAPAINFTIANASAPTVDTPTATSITTTGATLGANVASLGVPSTITARGVCYSTSANPSLINGATCVPATLSQTVPSAYTVSATGLTSNTTYNYRGYATNSTGTGYSASNITFTTPAPDLTAGAVTPVTTTAGTPVTLSATVTNGGNADTASTFSNIFQFSSDGTDAGAQQPPLAGSSITGLTVNQSKTTTYSWTPTAGTYYIRSCADNTTAWVGTVVESNEGNNCGGWTTVVVTPAGSPPDAAITVPAINGYTTSGLVSFSGTTTVYAGASITTYEWWNGPTCGSGSLVSSQLTTPLKTFAVGPHTIYFWVKDSHDFWSTCVSRDFTIVALVADPGPNQTITLPTSSVTMAGSATTYPGGTITSYAWSKISGPATFTITNSANPFTTITGLVAGTYTFRLTATDNNNVTGTSDMTVTVNPAPACTSSSAIWSTCVSSVKCVKPPDQLTGQTGVKNGICPDLTATSSLCSTAVVLCTNPPIKLKYKQF